MVGVVNKEIIQKQGQIINYMYVLGDNNSVLHDLNASDINIDTSNKSIEEIKNLLYKKFISEFDKLQRRHDKHDKDFEKTHQENDEIIQQLKTQFVQLMLELKNLKIDTNRIEKIIENINSKSEQAIIEVGQDIMGHINWAFVEYEKEFSENLQEVYKNLKKSDNWKTKIKLSVPLLNLIGVNIEHSVKLNKYIKWIYDTF